MNTTISNFALWLKQNAFRLIFFILTFVLASYYTSQFYDSLFYAVNLNIAHLLFFILFIIISFTPPALTFIRMISKNQELYPEYSKKLEKDIKAGTVMGIYYIYSGDKLIDTVEIIAAESTSKKDFFDYMWEFYTLWVKKTFSILYRN